MDPITLSIIGSGVQGALGYFSGKSKAKQARIQAEQAAKLARLDTEYSPYVREKGYEVGPAPENNTFGDTVSGAFTGGMQGMNIYRGLQGDKLNADKLALLKKLSGAQQQGELGLSPLVTSDNFGANIYDNLSMMRS